jgi:glycine hydroxymethyltransferase
MQKNILTIIQAEEKRQAEFIELIASENYQSLDVLAAQSTVFANKYSE